MLHDSQSTFMLRLCSVQAPEAMVCARLVLLLAAMMLLASPLVKSVPVDYVDAQEPEEDVLAAADGGCTVTDFTELRAALTGAATYKGVGNKPCATTSTSATILLKCLNSKYQRGNGGVIVLDNKIKEWTIKPFCKDPVTVNINYGDNSDVAVMAAAGPGTSFTMENLIFHFAGTGACTTAPTTPCAIIKVEGFKAVSFKKVNINMNVDVKADVNKMPASGLHIKGADTIKLTDVSIKKLQDSGILVEDGGKLTAVDVKSDYNGQHGLSYTGCYAKLPAEASLSLEGSKNLPKSPVSLFSNNGGSGLYVDCGFAPAAVTKAVPVDITAVGFGKNAVHGMWLRGSFDVTAKGCTVQENGGSAQCGGGVRVILRNTAEVKTSLVVDGSRVTKNKAKYGAGICFQSRLAEGVTKPTDAEYKQSLLKLKGNPWLKDNEAAECGGGMATIGNMVMERMAIAIDKGIMISGNKAKQGKTWCDILAAEDEGITVLDNFKSIWFTESQ